MFTVLIPANNEAATIAPCLQAVLASDLSQGEHRPEIIVVANGCTDDTAEQARGFADLAAQKGWQLQVLDLAQGSKLVALNAGDGAARFGTRMYLDADVLVSPALMAQLATALECAQPRYASGRLQVADCATWISRAYRRIYLQVPFITHGVPGCGLFAVNSAGRALWGEFPDIISDDTFVRLQFSPDQRIGVDAPYVWPIVEGFANLVKVRRRQDKGVAQIAQQYPQLLQNDDKPRFGLGRALKMALRDPIGFGVYAGVALATRVQRNTAEGWSRGR